ncbi:MAG: hypothetical protein GVY18_08640 [Bacteroidetes bacterium]|jgi:hypothetical protein|nr:hypothetical protein [Bacteroidota bacterium]
MHRICFLIPLLVLTLSACDSAEDDAGVRIVRYDGPPIERTEFMDWVGQVEETFTGTRVVLTSATGSADIRGDSLILFYEPDEDLPVGGTLRRTYSLVTWVLHEGVIRIQDWEINGVVSGQFEGTLRNLQNPLNGIGTRTGGTFWVDLSEQP